MARIFTLTAGEVSAEISDLGGVVHRLFAPDRDGRVENVVLGLPSIDDYPGRNEPHFGEIVGRYANRIAGGRFVLDGSAHLLPRNDGENTLHGGPGGFGVQTWSVVSAEPERLALRLTSAAGANGFPGEVEVDVVYTLAAGGALRLDYRARTDAPTVLNLTNHTYWNLAGEGAGWVGGHVLQVAASRHVAAGAGQIPTGELPPVAGTPLDFSEPRALGERLRDPFLAPAKGYDHSLVVDGWDGETLVESARVEEPRSGRVLEIATTEPAVHVYSGNYLDATIVGSGGGVYRQTDGLALETQHFPDSPNQPAFPSTVLRPGEELASTTVFRLSAH